MSLRQALFGAMAFFGAVTSGNADDGKHDGNWWRSQMESAKYRYAAGFLDGMTVGVNFLEFGMSADILVKQALPTSYESAVQKKSADQTVVHMTGVQLVEALDTFYSDSRNSNIEVSNAVTVAVHSAAGTPHNTIDKMVEQFRKPGC